MARYHYTECGLKNVWLENIDVVKARDGEDVITIPYVNRLHRVIAEALVNKKEELTGSELRFLRAQIELTQTELGALLGKEKLTIGRWERGENPIDPMAETLIRLLVIERLTLAPLKIEEAVELRQAKAVDPDLRIDGTDPSHYRVAA